MSRGVLYVVWGQKQDALDRSIESVRRVHPELQVAVHRLDDSACLFDKSRMYEWSPFDETLFLDVDTVVLSRLDYGFVQARKYGVACTICECPWACRYPSIKGDLVEYNTGVLFWRKGEQTAALFSLWSELTNKLDSSCEFRNKHGIAVQDINDQCAFAVACHQLGFNPAVLPLNWNLRPKWQKNWFGSVRVWHDYDDPPEGISDRLPMEFFDIDKSRA